MSDLWVIGSEPIVGSADDLSLFYLGRSGAGVWLDSPVGDSDYEWFPAFRFLFRRK